MSEPEQTKHKRRLPTPRLLDGKGKRTALVTAVILLLAASAAAPFLLKWRQSQMRRYSGAEVNYGVKLLYDAEALGEFEVRDSFLAEEGCARMSFTQNGAAFRLTGTTEKYCGIHS